MLGVSRLGSYESVRWLARIVLLVVAGVFFDTLLRLARLESAEHAAAGEGGAKDGNHHHQHHYDTAYEELSDKARRFYAQRNMYMSLFTLFMVLVLYRRFKDIYKMTVLQLDLETAQAAIAASAAGAAVAAATVGDAAAADAAAAAEESHSSKSSDVLSGKMAVNDLPMQNIKGANGGNDQQLRRRRAD